MKILGILHDFRIFYIWKGSLVPDPEEGWKNSCPSALELSYPT
jgi:hypothetical protein